MEKQREIRQKVDELIRNNKGTTYSMEGLAVELGEDESTLLAALAAAIQCPYTRCQSFDTELSSKSGERETHHCAHCNRDFFVDRKGESYDIMGWYAED